MYCPATGVLWGKRSEKSVGVKRGVHRDPGTKVIPPCDLRNAVGHADEYLLSQVAENGRDHGVPWTSRTEIVQMIVRTDIRHVDLSANVSQVLWNDIDHGVGAAFVFAISRRCTED